MWLSDTNSSFSLFAIYITGFAAICGNDLRTMLYWALHTIFLLNRWESLVFGQT